MTDGVTEAARFQKERADLFVDYRIGMRGWMVRQLETWALSSYLTEKEAKDARRLAESIRGGYAESIQRETTQVPEEGGTRPSPRKGKARTPAKSPKRA